jgi:uncharacterized membrane protein
MTWLQRFRVRHYLRNSISVFPLIALVGGLALARLLLLLEARLGWAGTLDPDSVRAVLGTLAGAIFTFIVFVCSALLLVVQLASAQLTPRMIAMLFRDTVTKVTLAVFVFTFSFAVSALVRVGDSAPPITANIAGWCAVSCICLFIYLIDHIGQLLRPSGALRSVASQAHEVIDSVYPHGFEDAPAASAVVETMSDNTPVRTVVSTRNGVVLAFDIKGIVTMAARHGCLVELVPQVGNYVSPGDTLFQIYGGADFPAEKLLQAIAIGMERTMEQDPSFGFRVIVDIASKGLSPAINDPTTAVLSIDRIHHLLRHIGKRRLDGGKVRDSSGQVRLIYHTPVWEDYVALAITEIRHFGASSIQVARRLRGMLENLIKTLPEQRLPPLRQELSMLKKSAERFFHEPEDRAMADVSDLLGLGGMPETK